MREILFRGEHIRKGEKVINLKGDLCNSKWVYGTVFKSSTDFSIIYGSEQESGNPVENWPVYSDTVGQYTGLIDKNGKKIFEGDIVSVPMALNLGQKREPMVGFIEWLNGAFSVTWRDADYGRHFAGYLDDIEIIGNIYDNPELIG